MKKYLVILVIVFAIFMSFNKEQPDVLVIGTENFNGEFYDGWSYSIYDNDIRKLVWGYGLLAPTKDGELVTSPLVKETIIDEKVWTFILQDDLKFSNGDPLTAKDVKFTYDFFMDTKALNDVGGSSSLSEYIEDIKVDEEKNSVTFTLSELIFTSDTSVFFEKILDSNLIESQAQKENMTVQQYVRSNISNPIGYGPYKIIEYSPSQFIKLEINEYYPGNYAGDKPSIETLIVKPVPGETRVTQLLTGEVDLLTGLFSETNIDAVIEDKNTSTNSYYRHGGGQLTFHSDFGPTQLLEVRKAFAYEVDRIKFRDLFLGKYGIASNAPYSRNMWMLYDSGEELGTKGKFETSLKNYDILDADGNWDREANLLEAHRLLDSAAKRVDGEYARLTKENGKYLWDGKELTLNLAILSMWSDAINLTLTNDIQKEFGIKVNIDILDWSILADHLYGSASTTERKYHIFAGGSSYGIKEDPYENWSETKILPYGQGSSLNSARYFSDDVLLDNIRFSDPSTSEGVANYKKYWREWIVSINEDLPILPMYSNNFYDAYSNRLENFETNALWDWPQAIVKAKIKK